MNRIVSFLSLVALTIVLSGCGLANIFDVADYSKSLAPDETVVRSGRNLSMPPDLQLRAPSGPVTEDIQSDTATAQASDVSAPPQLASATPVKPEGDIYERNGISKFHADGKKKTDSELKAELKEVYLAKKRQKNARYGTIWNIGNIFKDE